MATILHDSDCAAHNGPALPVEPCDCGAADIVPTLKNCAQRCQYDGDLFDDQGIEDRRDASWQMAKDTRAVLAKIERDAPNE